jgi:hypothetical protein
VRGDRRLGEQGVAEGRRRSRARLRGPARFRGARRRRSLARRRLHGRRRRAAAEWRAQVEHEPFAHHEPAGGVEVRAHPRRVDLQPGERLADAGRGAAGQRERLRERLPLRVPGAGRALVLLRHRGQQRRGERRHAQRARPRAHRADRVLLVRQRGGPARAGDHLPHLGLGEQHEVEPDLAHRPGGDGERRAEFGHAAARRVPRQVRGTEAEPLREPGHHARAVAAERGERARRAAELHVEPGAREAGARVERRVEPAGGLQPEGDRQRLLEQRTAGHRGLRMRPRQRGAVARHSDELLVDERDGPPRDEHRGGVEHVLARRAPVDVGGVVARRRAQALHERHHRVAGRERRVAEPGDVGRARAAGGGDRLRRGGGDRPRLGLRRRERRLRVEHRPDPGPVGYRLAEPRRRGQGREQAGHRVLPSRVTARRTAPTRSCR